MEGENGLVRKKRVNPQGEWEYECVVCDNWLEKEKFSGCSNFVDAYGNCLMCISCRAKKAQARRHTRELEEVDEILTIIGYYEYPDRESWYKAMIQKYNL